MKLKELLQGFLKSADKEVFPRDFTCDICGAETFSSNLCPGCLKTVTFNDKITCPVCGRKTKIDEICIECKYSAPVFRRACSPLVYDGGAVKLIAKFKNGGAYLKEWFADMICEMLNDFSPFECIVYVPMTKKAERKRGYNQAKELAKAISKRCGVPVSDAVIKVRETVEQKSLSLSEREKNLASCFKVSDNKNIKGNSVLVVDDVLTTGATANAVCRKILKAGAVATFLATVTSVERKENTDTPLTP